MPHVHHATASILAIGDELTLGQGLDTNSAWLSQQLVAAGIVPLEHATVPDDRPAIAAALRRIADRADLLISTGGLGPTEDDLTRDAPALEAIRARFAFRKTPMPERNRVQALRPASARCLPNANGTAPGLHAK